MVFLLLAILSSATISIIMRISSHKVKGNLSMLAANYLVCTVLGAWYADFDFAKPGVSVAAGLGMLNGVLLLAGFALLQRNTRRNGIVLSSIFMKLGLLVPMVVSVVFFHEKPTAVQIVGFCLAVGAIVLINLRKDTHSGSLGIGLILLLLFGGGADAMVKVFEELGPAALSDQFLCFSFMMALILCVGIVIAKRERPGIREFFFGACIGVPNFFSSKFLLGALRTLPAVVVYPTFCVTAMLLVTLSGVVVFGERLSKHQWVALCGIVAALIMLNI